MTKKSLAMEGVKEQSPSRGALGAALAYELGSGKQKAMIRLFNVVAAMDDSPVSATAHLEALEKLSPERLARELFDALQASDTFSEPAPDLSEIGQRSQSITRLAGDANSRPAAEARAAAGAVVESAFDALRESLDSLLAENPKEVAGEVQSTKTQLKSISFPDPNPEPTKRLRHILRGSGELTARRSSLPRKTVESVGARLINQGLRLYEESLHEACRQYVQQEMESSTVRFQAFLDDKTRRAAEYQRRVEEIRRIFVSRSSETQQRENVSRTSVVLPLTGPDDNEVLSAMLDRDGHPELVALCERLRQQFQHELIEFVRKHRPDAITNDSSIVWLLSSLQPHEAADVFERVVESRLGQGHSLYALIEKYGVEQFATDLFLRAGHTCQLTQRNTELFNVPTATLAIVRMPAAHTEADKNTHDDLQGEFERLGRCEFPPNGSDEVISIVRLEMGWPIGIEGQNNILAQRYRSASSAGHLPHLLGVLGDLKEQ